MSLKYLPSDHGFLKLPTNDSNASTAEAKAVIIPFGLEKTVSYESGTALGPQAAIDASPELEHFDEVFWKEAFRDYGIATAIPVTIADSMEDALHQIEHQVYAALEAGQFPLTLGGEHSLTAGAIRPFAKKYDQLTILQFDAHADLRDGYEGEYYSHAAAMRRCLDHDNINLVSVGIRNISAEEIPFLENNPDRINIFWAKDKGYQNIDAIAKAVGNGPVYITFDVDGFDSSLMPATGTPEPGGMFWDDVMPILEAISKQASIVGADIVELSPRAGLHACDFIVAKLAYKILSYALIKS